jgi:dipeptidyl aminopeptidase/acylaminoacyl peptidase
MAIRLFSAALLSLLMLTAPAWAAFPGRNGKIAFYTQRDNLPNIEIYSMNPDGSGQVNLTRTPFEDFGPEWSPDGSKIAFLTERDDTVNNRAEIYTMNPDGSGQLRITETPGHENNVTWSPDGTRMAFYRDGDIHVMNATGSGDTVLLGGPTEDSMPAWSPDGSKIAFVSTRDGNAEIYVMNSDGTNLVRLTNHPATDLFPDWSPDGSRIAFETTRDALCCFDFNIYAMRADGSEQRPLTTPGPRGDDLGPAWSPDGTKIAFSSQGGEINRDIHVMNADGSDPVNIAQDPSVADGPSWQPLQNRAPDCSTVTASPAKLSPPNRRLVRVRISGATDVDGDVVGLTITGVTQDEPVGVTPDALAGPAPDEVRLRAERDPRGNGRVYRISFDGDDGHGGTCTGAATVQVRKGARPAIDSAPPSFDSFG